jgi:hypothetical protein
MRSFFGKFNLKGQKHYVFSFLIGTSLIFSSLPGQAVHLLHTASTFAEYAEDIRVGIEVEFTGLSLTETLKIVQGFGGGQVTKKDKKIKTTLKEINASGMVFNEAIIPEWVIQTTNMGEITIKVDNNQVDDNSTLNPQDTVLELVTSPIRKAQILKLQEVISALKNHGAKGTADGEAVSIQYNTEINAGNLASYKWQSLIDLMRVYLNPRHREQIDAHLEVPDFRKDYISLYSKGFQARLFDPQYKPTSRELFDDFFYRQSLELLGHRDAWDIDIKTAQQILLSQKNPVVPLVVKQNKLRISSLLAMAFPEDPITKIYISSGWINPAPLVEWREFNNDFNVVDHYREVMGLMYMTKRYGSFDHDTLMSQLSGIEEPMIRDLRKQSFAQIKNNSKPTLFRYFIGNPKTVDREEYKELTKAYQNNPVGFLPFYEQGLFPLSIPGDSIVMHRNQFHRFNILGKFNPGLINGFIMQSLENKYVEMRFWNDYAKVGIPKTSLVSDLHLESLSAKAPKEILSQVKNAVATCNESFPKGWVLKGLFDLGTEKDILSDKTDLAAVVDTYLNSDFETYKTSVYAKFKELKTAPEYALTSLKEHKGYKGWKVLQLLSNTKNVIIQERFNINKEFRVEIVAGHVLGGETTVDRYGYTQKQNGKWDASYQHPTRDQILKAEAFAKMLIDSLPVELRGMTFGLDVAITNEGQAVMIESNPGGNSNFLYEEESASVKALSKFLSKVPAMQKNGQINSGLKPQEQMQFIKQKFTNWGIDTLSLYPGMKFMNDRIEDQEFKKLNKLDTPNLNKKASPQKDQKTIQQPKAMKCEKVFN